MGPDSQRCLHCVDGCAFIDFEMLQPAERLATAPSDIARGPPVTAGPAEGIEGLDERRRFSRRDALVDVISRRSLLAVILSISAWHYRRHRPECQQ